MVTPHGDRKKQADDQDFEHRSYLPQVCVLNLWILIGPYEFLSIKCKKTLVISYRDRTKKIATFLVITLGHRGCHNRNNFLETSIKITRELTSCYGLLLLPIGQAVGSQSVPVDHS